MDVFIQNPDGTVTHASGTPEEFKDFFGVTSLLKSSDEVEGLEPGVYAVADGWTPDYLTTGKLYRVDNDSGCGGKLIDDTGDDIHVYYGDSSHLNGGAFRKVVVE